MEKQRMIANHDEETKRLYKLYLRQCLNDDIKPQSMAHFIREGYKWAIKSQIRIEGVCGQTLKGENNG